MSAAKKITVLLVEDHAVVRQGLCTLLEISGAFAVVAQAQTGREAVGLAARLQPEVIVMDIAMPDLNGLEATRQILAREPGAKILILSAHSDDEYVERLTAAGALGFLEKQSSAEILVQAIQVVARGNSYFSPTIARRRAAASTQSRNQRGASGPGPARLTSRESEVLQLVAEGRANKQIAATLAISIKTVEKHRQQVMNKLNIHETAGLTRYAIARGIIESSVQVTII